MNNTTMCEGAGCEGPHPLLVLPVVLSVVWVLVDLFYASSLLGFAVNSIANFFMRESGIHIGGLRVVARPPLLLAATRPFLHQWGLIGMGVAC